MGTEQTPLRRLAWSVAGLLMIGQPAVSQAADDYLKALQAEAQSLDAPNTTLPTANAPRAEGWSTHAQGLEEELAPDLSRAEFESELQKNFFGSFSFYSRLNNVQRDAVYSRYRRTGKLVDVQDEITQRLKQ